MLTVGIMSIYAQVLREVNTDGSLSQYDQNTNTFRQNGQDSAKVKHKEIPRGLKVWTVDERFGERTEAAPDTLQHLFMNTVFTSGLRGEYNTLGNYGASRISRIYADRDDEEKQFIFTTPFSFFIKDVKDFHFTNTYSPITNLSYYSCGDKSNGEDRFTAKFAVNAGKKIGMGFIFDYIYGRGYYSDQNTSLMNFTLFGSYMGDKYNAHLLLSANYQKQAENGGITDDAYITHPETFQDNFIEGDIPTVLTKNWNRNNNQHLFFSHRYSLGFNRKVPMTEEEINAKKFAMESKKRNDEEKTREKARKKASRNGDDFDEDNYSANKSLGGRPDDAIIIDAPKSDSLSIAKNNTTDRIAVSGKEMADSLIAAENKAEADTAWLKNEFVPVTSFIHTLKFDRFKRIYQAYQTPEDYYADTFFDLPKQQGDSIRDLTRHYELRNTFALALLEGFNKWAKAGIKVFVSSHLRHFTLPDSISGMNSFNEHNLSIGGQLLKSTGKLLRYNVTAETWLVGEDAGQFKLDGDASLAFKFLGDTVKLAATAFIHNLNPTFYYRHYHSRHYWWDHTDLDKILHNRIEGRFSLARTNTQLRVAFDNLTNYTYFATRYNITDEHMRTGTEMNVRQCSDNLSVMTVQLNQDFRLGILNWENSVTYQTSSNQNALPVPDFNIYSNLYLKFKIARVLSTELGADVRYFTEYYAPEYVPGLGQFAVNESDNKTKIGNYPWVNVYANFNLKTARFFVMYTHVNSGSGRRNYFLTPHYPTNTSIFRIGVSWNFFN